MSKNKENPVLLKIDGELKDLTAAHDDRAAVDEIFADSPEALDVYRHSCAHLLAHAVTELFPGTQYGIGPALDTGFYYDFLTPHPFTPEDLEKISKRMKQLVKQNLPIRQLIWNRQEAIEDFDEKIERTCEKFLKKGELKPIDIIGRLEFWKTEYMSDLFYVASDIRNIRADIDRLEKAVRNLEKKLS